jgi:Spy/CpxP family protein refolding chaperone
MTPRGKTRLKVWLIVVGVFLLGAVTGASLNSLYRMRARGDGRQERGRPDKKDHFEEMKRDLNLSDQQATEIRAIIEQSREEYRTLRNEIEPRNEAVRAKARARMRELLNPEQQQRFDARIAKQDARHGEGRRRER